MFTNVFNFFKTTIWIQQFPSEYFCIFSRIIICITIRTLIFNPLN